MYVIYWYSLSSSTSLTGKFMILLPRWSLSKSWTYGTSSLKANSIEPYHWITCNANLCIALTYAIRPYAYFLGEKNLSPSIRILSPDDFWYATYSLRHLMIWLIWTPLSVIIWLTSFNIILYNARYTANFRPNGFSVIMFSAMKQLAKLQDCHSIVHKSHLMHRTSKSLSRSVILFCFMCFLKATTCLFA